jgi:MraZ protein
MFLGTYFPKLDEKSRLILPAKFRDELAGGLVITKGQEHCLYVFAQATFADLAQDLLARERAAVQLADKKLARMQVREFASSASDEVPDRQGRITVPGELRRYADIDRNVVVSGAIDRLEIWDLDVFRRYQAQSEPAYAEDDDWDPRGPAAEAASDAAPAPTPDPLDETPHPLPPSPPTGS